MARKFVLEFDMDNDAFYRRNGREVWGILRGVAELARDCGSHLDRNFEGKLRDSNGNTIGHFEIVETDESEG